MFVFDALVPWTTPAVVIPPPIVGSVTVLSLVGIGVGVRSFWKTPHREQPVLIGVGIFCGLYGAVHLFWHVAAPRYAIPVLPCLLVFMVRGINQLFSSFKRRNVWAGLVLGIAFLFYGYRNALAVHESLWAPDVMKGPPWRSLAWLKENTPPDSQVISGIASSVDLYAERRALSGIPATNVEYFLYQTITRRLQYIVDRDVSFLTPGVSGTDDPNSLWMKKRLWIAHYPRVFRLLFNDPIERTAIYRIVPDAGFAQAYECLKAAAADYNAGRLEESFRLVRECLTAFPRMGSATNYLGALYMKRMDLRDAEGAFRKTIEVLPDFPDAMLNLATVYRMAGQTERSEEYVQRALEVSEVNGERDPYSQKIAKLRQLWDQHVATILLDVP